MSLSKAVISAAAAFGFAGPVFACERDPFLFQLPGETVAQAKERSDGYLSDSSAKRRIDRQDYDFRHATAVYLARVVSKTPPGYSGGSKVWPSTTVRPLHALKGKLPTTDRTLTDETWSGMCGDRGDGDGAWGSVGDPIVVFEGLPKSDERPRGIDSFRTRFIRVPELLDKLRVLGKDLE